MRYICTNSAGLETEHGHKVKLEVLTPLNFLTPPSFSVTLPSCHPASKRASSRASGRAFGRAPCRAFGRAFGRASDSVLARAAFN